MSKPPRAKRSFVETRDGWKLCLYHYIPGESCLSGMAPVLLVHGLGANHHNLDPPDPKISLAHFLHHRGHDVWLVDLRGAGRSRPPGWPLRRRQQFDFDDYVHRDVPAVMRRVLDESSASSLFWVGHSMGGMLAYAAMELYDQRLFRAVSTVAAPAFTEMKHKMVDLIHNLRFMLNVVPWIPYRLGSKVAALAPGLVIKGAGGVVANPEMMDPLHVQQLLRTTTVDLPARLMRQFAEWYGGDHGFTRGDGLLDYYDHLGRITAPVQLIAGAGDGLTPPADIRFVYDQISSVDKDMLICGRENGFSADYGHIDLVLGIRAPAEVFPHIARWIEAH